MTRIPSFNLLAAAFWLITPSLAHTNSIVVPAQLENSFGRTSGSIFVTPPQFQQIYGASHFSSLPSDVLEITAVSFRWDETLPSSIDFTAREIKFHMGTYSQSDVEGGNSYTNPPTMHEVLPNPIPVFSKENVHLMAPANRSPSMFDVQFILQRPFIYDRRNGALVLQGQITYEGYAVDAEWVNAPDGYYLHYGPFGETRIKESVLITKFLYRVLPVITSTRIISNSLEIEFEAANGADVTVESAGSPEGPYTAVEEPNLSSTPEGKLKATIRVGAANRFFRIQLQ